MTEQLCGLSAMPHVEADDSDSIAEGGIVAPGMPRLRGRHRKRNGFFHLVEVSNYLRRSFVSSQDRFAAHDHKGDIVRLRRDFHFCMDKDEAKRR